MVREAEWRESDGTNRPGAARTTPHLARAYRFEPESQPIATTADMAERVSRFSLSQGVSPSETLLTAWQCLLFRSDFRNEISVGVHVPGEALSTPSFRVVSREFGGDPSFRKLLSRARVEPAGPSFLSSAAPASAASEEGAPELSRFASVLFGYGESHPFSGMDSRFDLALWIFEEPEGLRGSFIYDSEVFDASAIRSFQAQYFNLLEGAMAAPDQPVRSLPLLTQTERHRILVEWNDTGREQLAEANVARLFERQAARTPASVAVVFGVEKMSYGELDARSNRLARALVEMGIGPGVLAGICMQRSLNAAVSVLGTLKAGGAYVALDPEYPRERLDFMLEDSHAPVLLTDEATAPRLTTKSAVRVVLGSESVNAMLAAHADTPLTTGATPQDLAYVIYTSGSTGRPKGVAMPHRALLNLIAWQTDAALNPAAKTLQFASLNFDVSFQEMFCTWCGGGTLQLVSETTRRDPAALWKLITGESVERIYLPFVALAQLAEAAEQEGSEAPALREVITAGEQLQITPRIRRLFTDGRRLQNQYGPSESHVVTSYTLPGPSFQWPTLPPIGRPISNTRIYLLDRYGEPVPVGTAGELHIGGVAVAHGYWNRPELSAERFIPDPFEQDPGACLYKTGDLARYGADGEIEFLGRLDQQVKIRGYRVEPGEISAALGQHPDIRESVVVTRDDATGSKFLVAYVVARPERSPPNFELRSFLKGKVPDYMIPSLFVTMRSLPLTPSGKVDHRALPGPGSERPELDKPFIAPRDAVEVELAKIWEKALDMKSVGVCDDFFELGGHSLIAGRVFAAILKTFGKNLPPSVLVVAPTVEQLASFIREPKDATLWSSLVPIQPRGSLPPLFCMHAGAGTVLFYYDLARELGSDQPVFGLQAQGLYGNRPPHTRVEDMAAHYLREIRQVQPKGPYFLAGFCFGATLAFEMAHQLRRDGERVAFLCSFDGAAPRYDGTIAETPRYAGGIAPGGAGLRGSINSRVAGHWSEIRSLSTPSKMAYVAARLRSRTKKAFRAGIIALCRAARRPLPAWIRQDFFLFSNRRAEWKYVARPYPGRMIIFESHGCFRDLHLGWEGLLEEGLEIHEIPGEHRNHRDLMTGEFIRDTTVRLKQCLALARDGEGTR